MKTSTLIPKGIMLGTVAIAMACTDDQDFTPPAAQAVVITAVSTTLHIDENGDAATIAFSLSRIPKVDGILSITLDNMGARLITEPLSNGREVQLPIIKGQQHLSFRVVPVNNNEVDGNIAAKINFVAVTPGFVISQPGTIDVLLFDDDLLTDPHLADKPKGYSIGGPLGFRKTYSYNELGLISEVLIESGMSVRRDTYFYDDAGRISRINAYPEVDRMFIWEGDRIIKSENIESGVLKSYTEYDYDARGNVSGTANWFRQPNGEYVQSFVIVYLYFDDNNLYKSLYYVPVTDSDEMMLLSTRTYDNYINAENPFPMVDILPTVKTQHKLPGTYREEGNGVDLRYELEYDFLPDGRVTRRHASNGTQVETVEYHYY